MSSRLLPLPWSRTLATVAIDLDRGRSVIVRSNDTNRRQWATSAHRGLRGSSFAAAEGREERVSALRDATAELIGTAVSVLSRVASLQSALEDEYDRVIGAARTRGLAEVAGVVIALTDDLLEESEVFNLMLGRIRREGLLLDRHCAARLELLLPLTPFDERRKRCVAALEDVYTPAPARLPLPATPAVSATDLHELNMADADDGLRDLADRFPGMVVLETGDGHLVAAFGDIDSAESVITMVSGVGSGDPESVAGALDRGRALHREVGGAVIVWNGYRPPATVIDGGQDISARLGAAKLRTFMHSLTERRGSSVHRTVVAHSYGSLVTGLAAAGSSGGLDADAIMFLGSPGTGVAGADELQLNSPDPRILAARSPTDPIGLVNSAVAGVHGRDPASAGFGAEVIPAEGGHSDYFEDPAVLDALRRLRSH
ncbi:alpha/beta hydrolase [Corynebacterium sp. TAE3-ERU16]|uniref:alpha/beta hydrolase n=1 Tax=Corynebacterium sp. TAE3-ERU16 TaxID=2849493 RepID=UPI001C47D085|nr:alpha/beta hydrolase [Corynebacterium sp. TAE3-ERU16]MBV7293685.1 alpha/beta hydrolase family protein [Corynebacterium sp. TAE3-ERU16]